MPAKLFYSPDYNLRLLGLEKLHPFDGAKYGYQRAPQITQAPKLRDNPYPSFPDPVT